MNYVTPTEPVELDATDPIVFIASASAAEANYLGMSFTLITLMGSLRLLLSGNLLSSTYTTILSAISP